MALPERDKRVLHEMEAQFEAEDPALASALSLHRHKRWHWPRRWHRSQHSTRSALVIGGLLAGVLLMGFGLARAQATGIAVALLGFVILLASASVVAERVRAGKHARFGLHLSRGKERL